MLTGSCCSAGRSKCCRIIMGCILAHQISPMSSEKHIHSLYADVERRAIVNNICSLLEQIIFISCRKLNKGCLLWHNGQISLEEQQKDFRGVVFCHPKNKSKQVSFPVHMACESPWYLLLTVLTAREAWANTSGVLEPEATIEEKVCRVRCQRLDTITGVIMCYMQDNTAMQFLSNKCSARCAHQLVAITD